MYHNFSAPPADELRRRLFDTTPLGVLHRAIPFDSLVSEIAPPPRAVSGKGCKPWFDLKAGIALQILKSYYRCSDARLLELVNGSWQLQLFCGIQLLEGEQIRDKGIVSRWRTYLSQHLHIDRLQLRCVQHWRPYMEHCHSGFCDATVFESYIAYPWDAGLLWRAIEDVYTLMQGVRKQLHLRASRINHHKRKARYLSFARRRQKSRRQTQRLTRWLLHYLGRLLQHLQALRQRYTPGLTPWQQNRLTTIYTLKEQQERLHFAGQRKVAQRIVSLCKPYVRPIIRGKEVKPVEFGAKVHLLQVDGINFLEHLSYEAFNEGIRLKSTVGLQRRYFGACHQLGADAIYATNENRRYCTEQHIATSFVPKGKQGKLSEQKSLMRSILANVRATVLEGSLGNEKNHYCLNQIKAKTQANEMVWIFFCLLTCNARQIARRMQAVVGHKHAA